MDEEGYLYLTDRKSFMIISGGVNIYPQEIENLLITHPKVADVAVVGAPHEEMGEQVVAVIQPADWSRRRRRPGRRALGFRRPAPRHVKAPRRIDFMAELPRHPTGKLYKRLIRDGTGLTTRAGSSEEAVLSSVCLLRGPGAEYAEANGVAVSEFRGSLTRWWSARAVW